MSEQTICTGEALVYYFDQSIGDWSPADSGGTTVGVYYGEETGYRIVSFSSSGEAAINMMLDATLQLTKLTDTFISWLDAEHTYGVNFNEQQDAEAFYTNVTGAVGIA